jgi:hypothetical protein
MSAPKVGVLEVMDRDRRLLCAALVASDRAEETLRQHDEARAAVAELIEAARAFPDEPNPYTYRMALAKLRAVLARIGGAA